MKVLLGGRTADAGTALILPDRAPPAPRSAPSPATRSRPRSRAGQEPVRCSGRALNVASSPPAAGSVRFRRRRASSSRSGTGCPSPWAGCHCRRPAPASPCRTCPDPVLPDPAVHVQLVRLDDADDGGAGGGHGIGGGGAEAQPTSVTPTARASAAPRALMDPPAAGQRSVPLRRGAHACRSTSGRSRPHHPPRGRTLRAWPRRRASPATSGGPGRAARRTQD